MIIPAPTIANPPKRAGRNHDCLGSSTAGEVGDETSPSPLLLLELAVLVENPLSEVEEPAAGPM
jgi:hypothetical protein